MLYSYVSYSSSLLFTYVVGDILMGKYVKKRKVAINSCFGGFSLSNEAIELLSKYKGRDVESPVYFTHDWHFLPDDIPRDDPDLIKVIEELGSEKASGRFAELTIVKIPPDIKWTIEGYDGLECVSEAHRTWS